MPTVRNNYSPKILQRFFLFIPLLCSYCLNAQINEEDFILHTRKNGLTHNYVTGIAQDEKGYIWISTLQGLNRYDGTEYFPVLLKQFNCFDEYEDVWRMKYFGNNEIGITSNNGAFTFNTQTLSYRAFIVPPLFGNSKAFNKCRDIEKVNDSLYATSTGTGFYLFDQEGKIKLRKDGVRQEEIGNGWFQFGGPIQRLQNGSLLQENATNYFVYTLASGEINDLTSPLQNSAIKKILIPDPNSTRVRYFPDPVRKQGLLVLSMEKNTLDMVDDYANPVITQSLPLPFSVKNEINWQSDLYWLSDTSFAVCLSSSGFYVFQYNKTSKILSVDPKKYFPDYFITSVFCDKNKNLWIGSDKGIWRLKIQISGSNIFDLKKIAGLDLHLQLRAIYADSTRIYAGGRLFSGLLILHPDTKQLIRRVILRSAIDTCNTINSIIPSPNGGDTLWLCTGKGLFWFNTRNENYGELDNRIFPAWLKSYGISYCMRDSRDNLWFRHNEVNTVSFFNKITQTFNVITPREAGPLLRIALCFGIGEDADGNIWISGDGISRWNPTTEKCDTLIQQLSGLPTDYVDYKIFDSDNEKNIWMTTAAGIFRWNPVTGKSRLFTTKDGLPHNITVAYPSDLRNHLFIHTYKGMGVMDRRTGKTIAFTEKDGLPEPANLRWVANCYDKSRREYLFGYDNLLVALYNDFKDHTAPPQSLNISMLHIYHDTTIFHPPSQMILNYRQNDLGICFNTVNFTDPENQAFAYRILQQNNTHWIGTGRQSTIYLSDLSPGIYHLEVKVMAINKRWPDMIKAITIVITPPYWKENWFMVLLGLISGGLLFLIYWKRVKGIRQKANLDKQLAQTEMKALHAQMNPHFVFNCLNSINEMILLNENEQASHYLGKFAHLIRTTLDHSTREWVSLRQTTDYLKRYIEMEKIRKDDFQFIMETENGLNEDDIFLPPMLIQPLLENAIWHGKNKEASLTIHTRFQKKGNQLLCIVSDNGIGINQSLKKNNEEAVKNSIGISNIKQRIRLLNEKYNLQSELILEDKKPGLQTGTIATLHLPLKTADL